MNDKEFLDAIHMEIHAVRRIPNYKASIMEKNISRFVLEKFGQECKECRDIQEKIKATPIKEQKGFFNKLKEAID